MGDENASRTTADAPETSIQNLSVLEAQEEVLLRHQMPCGDSILVIFGENVAGVDVALRVPAEVPI
jgi:hypothetical protein